MSILLPIVRDIIILESSIYEFNESNRETLYNEQFEVWNFLNKIHLRFDQILYQDNDGCMSPPILDSSISLMVEAGMDRTWEILNSGTWKDVPVYIKHIYTLFCFYKMATMMISGHSDFSLKLIVQCIQVLDRGILLGYNNTYVTRAVEMLMEEYHSMDKESAGGRETDFIKSTWKTTGIRGAPIKQLCSPSLVHFQSILSTTRKRRPLKLLNCVDHWPALSTWNIEYFRLLAGPRLVPIELGKKYTDEDWSQRLMGFNEFLDQHMKEGSHAYLAQHDLLSQIPELKQDLLIPDYCYVHLDEDDLVGYRDVDLNMWFGPPGTVTPFHWDLKHNLLVQVMGFKRILLASPDTPMYPYEGLLNNTSRIDPEIDPEVLAKEFPDFVKHIERENPPFSPIIELVLTPGEMLYIPPKYWHHVRSLSTSISVSFWF